MIPGLRYAERNRSIRLTRKHTFMDRSTWARCLALITYFMAVGGIDAGASPYYSVTDLGPNVHSGDVLADSSANGVVTDAQGISYPFPRTVTGNPTITDRGSLPEETVYQGASNPQPWLVTMRPLLGNNSGTILGTWPSGALRSDPWSDRAVGYTQLLPDGTYNGFHTLIEHGYPNGIFSGFLDLNVRGEILANNQLFAPGAGSGEGKDLSSFLSPDDNTRYFAILGLLLDDHGDILAQGIDKTRGYTNFLLTPPDQPAPSPVPEPSALITWGAFSFLVVARHYRRRAQRPSRRPQGGAG